MSATASPACTPARIFAARSGIKLPFFGFGRTPGDCLFATFGLRRVQFLT